MGKATLTVKPNEQNIIIDRDFDASRDKVFAALTDKEKIAKWWVGPVGYTTEVDSFDPRDGGSWRYIQTDPEGAKFAFHGSFHKVSPEMVIQTFEFEGLPEPGHVALEKMTLTEADGKTHMHVVSTFMSVEDRDGMIQSGMEEGMQNTYNQLDEVLKNM